MARLPSPQPKRSPRPPLIDWDACVDFLVEDYSLSNSLDDIADRIKNVQDRQEWHYILTDTDALKRTHLPTPPTLASAISLSALSLVFLAIAIISAYFGYTWALARAIESVT